MWIEAGERDQAASNEVARSILEKADAYIVQLTSQVTTLQGAMDKMKVANGTCMKCFSYMKCAYEKGGWRGCIHYLEKLDDDFPYVEVCRSCTYI
jgi:hypothetical protein